MNECRACCRGSAPYFICRDASCICHVMKHLEAIKTPIKLSHTDHTANQAVGNVMKASKK